MTRLATVLLLLAGLAIASSASAVDLNRKVQALPGTGSATYQLQSTLASVLTCDDGNPSSAWYQDDTYRYGNLFTLPAGARVSAVEFAHYGFGISGPYNYDLEFWDPTSCTMITAVNGLVAEDAAGGIVVEQVYLCPYALTMGGNVVAAIDANTCAAPDDCYPDLLFDDQIGVFCPIVIDATAAACYDASSQCGPFLLRVEIDGCPVPTVPRTWGDVKVLYR